MEEPITLTEDFLDRCMTCGNKFDAKGIYDYYCSSKCQKIDEDRIEKMINEGEHPTKIMNDAMKKVVNKPT